MLMHEWQIFNAVRCDVGESYFFMAQPIVITVEDFVQWSWRRYGPAGKQWAKVPKVVGYVWTVVWFSYALPPFVRGLWSAHIIGADVVGPWAVSLGKEQAVALLR